MAIQFITMKCPACGAEINIESGREFSFCTYCGSKIMKTNDNEHIYRNIDEARIKEAETERMIRLRELEIEEKENARGRKSTFIAYGIALAFVLIGALLYAASPMAGMFGILIGINIALFAFVRDDERKKQRKKKYLGSNEAAVTEAMISCVGKNFNSVVMLFRGAGFTNVTLIPMHDLSVFSQKKNGQVKEVTINGNSEFEDGDIFPKNANVLIAYHSR